MKNAAGAPSEAPIAQVAPNLARQPPRICEDMKRGLTRSRHKNTGDDACLASPRAPSDGSSCVPSATPVEHLAYGPGYDPKRRDLAIGFDDEVSARGTRNVLLRNKVCRLRAARFGSLRKNRRPFRRAVSGRGLK